MAHFANNLIDLREGILTLRRQRQGFLAGLEQENGNRRASVANLLARFSDGFQDRARKSRADRATFLTNLQQSVATLRKGVRTDLGGGRQALGRLRADLAVHGARAVTPKASKASGELPRMPASAAPSEPGPAGESRGRQAGKRKTTSDRRHRK